MKNKKGWLEIVEAFTSVLLIAGVLIILAGNFRADTQNFSSQVYDLEHAILREIQEATRLERTARIARLIRPAERLPRILKVFHFFEKPYKKEN